jgi:regulator-associated protein of mTOR
MAVQPPSLPYARDEASTSQQLSYPALHEGYSHGHHVPGHGHGHHGHRQHGHDEHDEYEHELDMEGEDDGVSDEVEGDSVAAFQFWTAKRHVSRKGKGKAAMETALPWRLRSRLKTVNAGLFLCLNIGVDPPDIVKTNPCAKTECWVDPNTLPST